MCLQGQSSSNASFLFLGIRARAALGVVLMALKGLLMCFGEPLMVAIQPATPSDDHISMRHHGHRDYAYSYKNLFNLLQLLKSLCLSLTEESFCCY